MADQAQDAMLRILQKLEFHLYKNMAERYKAEFIKKVRAEVRSTMIDQLTSLVGPVKALEECDEATHKVLLMLSGMLFTDMMAAPMINVAEVPEAIKSLEKDIMERRRQFEAFAQARKQM